MRVGVIGASGFAGAELLRLVYGHPDLDLVFASGERTAGAAVGEVFPHLASIYPELILRPWTEIPESLDAVFVALPQGVSQTVIPKIDAGVIIDLGGDFRLKDAATYAAWNGSPHAAPELLPSFTYGLVELNREKIAGARAVSVPGCYVTGAVLTLAPLIYSGMVESQGIIVDAASGVSGAGNQLNPSTSFVTANESFTAYGLLSHRHTPEMEMALGANSPGPVQLLFTPHLAPMNRGILTTSYLRPNGSETTDELLRLMANFYNEEPFISVSDRIPSTGATIGSNSVHMTVRRDDRTGWVVVIGALDNLIKGAAGQAIQCLNVALALPEGSGLTAVGFHP